MGERTRIHATDSGPDGEAEALFGQLLEAVPSAVIVTDREGTILHVNRAAEQMFRYARTDLTGRPSELLVPEEFRDRFRANRTRFWQAPPEIALGNGVPLDGRRSNGDSFPAEISLGRCTTVEGPAVVCTVTDMTRRRKSADDIRNNLEAQKVIGEILRLSLEPLSLEEFLQDTLELLLDLPWLAILKMGAIFIVEEEPEVLVMKAQVQLNASLLTHCARVPFGHCLCGRAASTARMVFADHLDDRHEIRYEGIQEHGHYCTPILSENEVVGVINLYLQPGHRASTLEQRFLVMVADALAGTIHRKQAEADLLDTRTQLLAAQSIQEHILPSEPPAVPGFRVAGSCRPAEFAAGDHFDHFLLRDGSLAVGVGDVSGHGFSSALLMASTHAYIHALASMDLPINRVFDVANENLEQETDTEQFITSIFARIDPATRELTYVSAGHPPAYVIDAEGRIKAVLESTGIPLAILPDTAYAVGEPVTLASGDVVLLLTDGVLEARSPDGKFFDEERVIEVVRERRGDSAPMILEALIDAVDVFHGNGRHDDDVTAVVIKVDPAE